MGEAETYVALTRLFRQVFDDDTITIRPETTADDIPGWDSQAHITLVVATEAHFDITFRTAEVESLRNVAELVQLIELKRTGARPQ